MFIPNPWYCFFLHPGSRCDSRSKKQQQGGGKISFLTFYRQQTSAKLRIVLFWTGVQKNILANWQRIVVLFIRKIDTKLSVGSGIWDPRSGKNYPGFGGQKCTGSRIPDPQHCKCLFYFLSRNTPYFKNVTLTQICVIHSGVTKELADPDDSAYI